MRPFQARDVAVDVDAEAPALELALCARSRAFVSMVSLMST